MHELDQSPPDARIPLGILSKALHRLARLVRGDDYWWPRYSERYARELEHASGAWTLETDEFEVVGEEVRLPAGAPPFHANYQLLYGALLRTRPASVLEIGTGWGHQMVMVERILGVSVRGVDIGQQQIEQAIRQFPQLAGRIRQGDVTEPLADRADFVFCNAVTMHLGQARAERAVRNMYEAAHRWVFLVENWTAHDYDAVARSLEPAAIDWIDHGSARALLITKPDASV